MNRMVDRIVLFLCLVHLSYQQTTNQPEITQDKSYWKERARNELKEALGVKWNTKRARNVIVFVGDGMGVNTVTASRIYRAGEESSLAFEHFPHIAAIKTYSANKQVSDSAATGTAIFCGVKTNYNTLGVDSRVRLNDCDASLEPENRLDSIMVWAQEAGKATGFATTTRITHATPAATYAKSANRHWECDSKLPTGAKLCKDIARQLVEDTPGRNFNVILGGGRQAMVSSSPYGPDDPIDSGCCTRSDGLDLISKWWTDRKKEGHTPFVARNTRDLLQLNTENVTHLLGVFRNSHFPWEHLRDKSETGTPSLALMSTAAVKLLNKNSNGFFLMVEGGMIDQAHHNGTARRALDEAVQLSNAVNETMQLLKDLDILEETLVIVTSDHGHTLSMNGYPLKGSDILGYSELSKEDKMPYTTLTYGVATMSNWHYKVLDGKVTREDPRNSETRNYLYKQQAAVPTDISAHGGGDVLLFARGPMAHLFHKVHEQNYIPQVISYAAKIGDFSPKQSSLFSSSDHQSPDKSLYLLLVIISVILNVFM